MKIRTKSLVGRYVHVLSTDPALDLKRVELPEDATEADRAAAEEARKDAVNAYRVAMETGDLSKLPLKPDAKPAIFEFTHLSADACAWLLDLGQADEGNTRLSLHAIALGLVGIKGCRDEDGKLIQWTRKRNPARGGFEALTDELLMAVVTNEDGSPNLALILELGGRVAQQLVPRKG